MPARSRPYPLGVHPRAGGVDVAVLASHAERVDFCLLKPVGDGRPSVANRWRERRVELPSVTHGVWHGFVEDVAPGQHYGFRVQGRWEPARGLLHNPAKLVLDPYARAVSGGLRMRPELFGHIVGADLSGDVAFRDGRDSAPYVPHGVVVDPAFDWAGGSAAGDLRPETPWARTVIYEAHVRGLTRRLPGVPEPLRGTYAGLAHPATIGYLTSLGITAVELLPVQTIGVELPLARRGVTNYWGYSTLGFFSPHAGYAAADTPQGVVDEFKTMVAALHAAGLEVLLDVVYNHTCEGDVTGPMLSWRGLDALTYYRLDGHGRDVDTTGCGNSLDFSGARVVQLTLDSLRYWVQEMHVDGFRFDLATTLARGREGFDPDHPLLVAAAADPALAGVKLIAEPWDLGPHGWRTGQFPAPWADWNDRFRDTAREFWLTGASRSVRGEVAGGVRELATRLAGSADTFSALRGPLASVNFVTAHDGFTTADLTAYDHKHNEANGEQNRDGSDNNRSWNHGVEGPSSDLAVLRLRRRSIRNLLGTLLLATGVPMIVAGDELGNSQDGNNNPYCQDNELTWIDWRLQPWQRDLQETVRHLIALRDSHPVLRQERFFAGRPVHADGTKDIAWFAPDGAEMDHDRWHDGRLRTLQMYLHAVVPGPDGRHQDESILVVMQGNPTVVDLVLPGEPWSGGYRMLWDSAQERPPGAEVAILPPEAKVPIVGLSVRVYGVVPVAHRGQSAHHRPS